MMSTSSFIREDASHAGKSVDSNADGLDKWIMCKDLRSGWPTNGNCSYSESAGEISGSRVIADDEMCPFDHCHDS